MRLLVDTHLLLWAAQGIEHLPSDAQTLMSDPENELFFSVASLWEIVIKSGSGREDQGRSANLSAQFVGQRLP